MTTQTKLGPDLELIRMGLTLPEVMELAWHDPCQLLTSQTMRAVLAGHIRNDGTLAEFMNRAAKWRSATMARFEEYSGFPRGMDISPLTHQL